MQRNQVSPVVIAAALSACAIQPGLLNSERIEQRFGSYGITVLQQDNVTRRSSLYSTENGVRVSRTYAIVRFVDPPHPGLAEAHQAVLGGESIGATLDSAGWRITKRTTHIGTVRVPAQHQIAELMRLESAATLGLHAYQLLLEKEATSIHYATIIEIHHPAYLTEADLIELYGNGIYASLDASEVAALLSDVLQ